MRITDPILEKFDFNQLASDAQNHLIHLVSSSKDKTALLTRLSQFYPGLVEVLKEKYLSTNKESK